MRRHDPLLKQLESAHSWEAIERIYGSLRAREAPNSMELLEMLAAYRTRPGVAALIALLCADSDRPLTHYFTRREIEDACVSHLEQIGQSGPELFKTAWAWWTVCVGPLAVSDRGDITLRIIARVPEDDHAALWLIGDGPLAMLSDSPDGIEHLTKMADANPRIRLAVQLAAEE